MAKILFGDIASQEILKEIQKKLSGVSPGFAVIQYGDDPASNLYIKNKINLAKNLNFYIEHHKLNLNIPLDELKLLIDSLNKNEKIHGIIVQMPLPDYLKEIVFHIAPKKDIDGLGIEQQGRLLLNLPGLRPCTPLGVIKLLEFYEIPLEGKKIAILGRSNLVGKPLALMLIQKNACVSIFHSKIDLENNLKDFDIICSAIGKPHFIQKEWIKNEVILIDIGIARKNGKICGDFDFGCYEKASAYTPMPGGIGIMTVASLAYNVMLSYLNKKTS